MAAREFSIKDFIIRLLGGTPPRRKRKTEKSLRKARLKKVRRPSALRKTKKKTGRKISAPKRRQKKTASPKKKKGQPKTAARKKSSRPLKKTVPKKTRSGKKPLRKKPVKRKTARSGASQKNSSKQARPSQVAPGPMIGEVTHYFSKIMVCVVKMRGSLSVGQSIRIKGKATDFTQKVESLQIESVNVPRARKGQLVGLKVKKPCREGDLAYLARI